MKRSPALLSTLLLVTLLATVPAEGASPKECFGMRPTTVGTNRDDVIVAGYEDNVIYAGKGNDHIWVDEDSDSSIYVCAGPGKDTIHEGPYVKVHGGDGYDTAVIPACSESVKVFQVEAVTVTRFRDVDPEDSSSSDNCGHY